MPLGVVEQNGNTRGDTSKLLNLVRRSDKPTFVILSSQPRYRRGTYKLVAFYIQTARRHIKTRISFVHNLHKTSPMQYWHCATWIWAA